MVTVDNGRDIAKSEIEDVRQAKTEKACGCGGIAILYYNRMRFGQDTKDCINVEEGARQNCVLPTLLFNLYTEDIIDEVLSQHGFGVIVNGNPIIVIRQADETVLIAIN